MSALTGLIATTLMVIGVLSVVKSVSRRVSVNRAQRKDTPVDGSKSHDPDIVEMRKNPETGAYEAKKK